MALEREMETYNRRLSELMAGHAGKFVVIHLDDVIGFADTLEEAVALGYDRFISEAFLARQVKDVEEVYFIRRSLKPCLT